MRMKLEFQEKPLCNVVAVYRERGNYLQRLEQFEKAILAYNEALRWNSSDIRSLLGRSLARAKATHYDGALADASRAAELEPNNLAALQIKTQTEYEKCSFERSLVLAYCGQRQRILPPIFAECARCAEETIRDCSGASASKVLKSAIPLPDAEKNIRESGDDGDIYAPVAVIHRTRMQSQPTKQVQEISRVEKQKANHISCIMASKYLAQMAYDKYFLTALCKDERLMSANKKGSQALKSLADNALADIQKRQDVLRERRPLYAARASEAAARERLSCARKERLRNTQQQHATDARRLVRTVEEIFEEHDTTRCLEAAEFVMEQISRKPINLLPEKEKYMHKLYELVANVFLDQKRVKDKMSEADREKRAFILLGINVSREPSRDSILRTRPSPPRDFKRRLRTLERVLSTSARSSERCYLLHELARLHADTKRGFRARVFALKCQSEARNAEERVWLLNATFLLARSHLLQNNRPEARAALIEGVALARSYGYEDVAAFFETCVNISAEGEVGTTEATLEKRERDMVSLMQDDDLKSAAKHLFRRMSVIPASRRFSVMPGTHIEDSAASSSAGRRASIAPKSQQPVRVTYKSHHPLGFQEFDI